MKAIYVILFLFLQNYFYAQTLSARVVDNNNNPVEGVKVFFDKTTIATSTNKSGLFEIPKPDEVSNSFLIIYHPLFETIIESETDNLLLTYELSKRADNLKVTNYSSSPFSKKEMLSVFRRILIGTGKNARDTKIINEEEISLEFDKTSNKLTAKSAQPLLIVNEALGYHIEYHLEEFEIEFSGLSLEDENISFLYNSGYSQFKDVDNTKTKDRDKALKYSLRYFFKELINKNYKALTYEAVVDDKKIKPEDLFRVKQQSENLHRISFSESVIPNQDDEYFLAKIELYYKDQAKIIELFKPFIVVNKFGNVLNSEDLQIIDNVFNKRLGDMIPINYN